METNQDFLTVGKVRDAHGLKGELYMVLFGDPKDWIQEVRDVFLVRNETRDDGKVVAVQHPFKLKRSKSHKRGYIFKVEGIETRTDAEGFQGALFQIHKDVVTSKPGERVFLRELEGFSLEKFGFGPAGKIVGFSTNGLQDLLVVENEKGTFEVPFVEPFIKGVNFTTKVLTLELPEGLLGEI